MTILHEECGEGRAAGLAAWQGLIEGLDVKGMTGRVRARAGGGGGRSGAGLVGRAEELSRLRRLLAQSRLVTVTGGAGVGKSTLAAHAAAAVGSQLTDSVVIVRWWDGAPGRGQSVARAVIEAMDGEAGEDAGRGVGDSVNRTAEEGEGREIGGGGGCEADAGTGRDVQDPSARAGPELGIRERGGSGERELIARLRGRRVLLVLDDFDPVRDECLRMVRALLQDAPGVRVIATGRQPLGLGQELVLRLGPLPVGAPEAGTEPGPAVALFRERARGVRREAEAGSGGPAASAPRIDEVSSPTHDDRPSTPTSTEAELRAISDICAQLEGVPLALELAAAQTALHTPAQLARMLRAGQGWLGRPEAPLRRHRSLRAAVGASYALCGQAERSVWARLSVFAGEFDEDAAVHVCAGGGIEPTRVASCLARLAQASVLEPVRDPGGVLQPRYRLPAAARGFGAERLESVGESATAAGRHLSWYRTIASTAHQLWSTGHHEQATLLLRDAEHDLRAALQREPRTAGESATALGMAVDLWFWWAVCGHAAEGRDYLRRLLPRGRADTPGSGQALWLAGWLSACTGAPGAEELLGQAWRVAVLSGDDATIGRVAHVQGVIALRHGETERAIEHLREAAHTVPDHAEHGPPAAISWAWLAVAQARVRPADALHSVRRASSGTQTRHDIWTRSMTQYAHALVEHLRGRHSRAWRRAHKSLAGVLSVAGPLGGASVHQLIAAIERGPASGAGEWIPPCGWDPPGT
ncbi:AAA family ATPase [Streptomyces sp. NPDC057302]|uniref:AAA family ATPase n=1 Tax=Streptomyces sp. NPDC057302 TaxID=3346094 RepID=UPI00362B2750